MREEDVKAIINVLKEKYKFDELDVVEFIIHLEGELGEKIPDRWMDAN